MVYTVKVTRDDDFCGFRLSKLILAEAIALPTVQEIIGSTKHGIEIREADQHFTCCNDFLKVDGGVISLISLVATAVDIDIEHNIGFANRLLIMKDYF